MLAQGKAGGLVLLGICSDACAQLAQHLQQVLRLLLEEFIELFLADFFQDRPVLQCNRRGRTRTGFDQAHLAKELLLFQNGKLLFLFGVIVEPDADASLLNHIHRKRGIALAEDDLSGGKADCLHASSPSRLPSRRKASNPARVFMMRF